MRMSAASEPRRMAPGDVYATRPWGRLSRTKLGGTAQDEGFSRPPAASIRIEMRPGLAYQPPAMNVPSPALVPSSAAATRPAPELSVVVPTFKERDNVPLLVEKLAHALEGVDWEVVFVDDNSPD